MKERRNNMELFEMEVLSKLTLILDQLKFLNSENSRREREAQEKFTEMGKDFGSAFTDAIANLLEKE